MVWWKLFHSTSDIRLTVAPVSTSNCVDFPLTVSWTVTLGLACCNGVLHSFTPPSMDFTLRDSGLSVSKFTGSCCVAWADLLLSRSTQTQGFNSSGTIHSSQYPTQVDSNNKQQRRSATATTDEATSDQGRNYKLTPRRRTKDCQGRARTATLHSTKDT